MTVALGFRPRSNSERMAMARLLASAPPIVAVDEDDGWLAACLAVAGRLPVEGARCDNPRLVRGLHRLGLDRPARLPADATVGADLTLRERVPAGRVPQLPVDGPPVTVILRARTLSHVAHALASVEAQGWKCEVVLAVLGEPEGLRRWLQRQRPMGVVWGEDPVAVVADAVEEARGEAVLVLDDDQMLLPGAMRLLGHVLFGDPDRAAVRGDVVRFDGKTGRVTGYEPAPTVPGALAARAALHGWFGATGATLVRRGVLVDALSCLPAGATDADLQLAVALAGRVDTAPVPVVLWRERADDTDSHRLTAGAIEQLYGLRAPADAADGHAWAAALTRVGRVGVARGELRGWESPWTDAERAVRSTVGLDAGARRVSGAVVVVDDGDVGALEATLARIRQPLPIWVDLEVPREPLAPLRRLWEGNFGMQERLARWVTHPAPWYLRLSSDPDWEPPPLLDPSLLPDLPAPDAVLALAAALDWPLPGRSRAWRSRVAHPAARGVVEARLALRRDNPRAAAAAMANVLRAVPTWRHAWTMTAGLLRRLGLAAEAETYARHAQAMSA